MADLESYQLLDFGHGRKLERFGPVCLDRPSSAAEGIQPAQPQLWTSANARFHRSNGKGTWTTEAAIPNPWSISCGTFRLLLKLTPFGHVGMFPEQASNWRWIATQVSRGPVPFRVLNLFAYTGASTLAAAAAGAEVVHVDAASNVVQWARQNASASALADVSIRWIVDDARRFVARELRRGRQFHALILDPPSYGHGPRNESWKLSSDLLPLLTDCRPLLAGDGAFVLLTCHSPGFGPAELGTCLQQARFGRCATHIEARRLNLRTADGRTLASGVMARWSNS
jgi:23S rRNA (cytosine1962-C5)-methyltransferase